MECTKAITGYTCDFCGKDCTSLHFACISCGKHTCYECSKKKGESYPPSIYLSGGDGTIWICRHCNTHPPERLVSLVRAYQEIDTIRLDWQHLRKRADAAAEKARKEYHKLFPEK